MVVYIICDHYGVPRSSAEEVCKSIDVPFTSAFTPAWGPPSALELDTKQLQRCVHPCVVVEAGRHLMPCGLSCAPCWPAGCIVT